MFVVCARSRSTHRKQGSYYSSILQSHLPPTTSTHSTHHTIHRNPYIIQKSTRNWRTVVPEDIEQEYRRLEVAPWHVRSPIAWGPQERDQRADKLQTIAA